MLLLDEPKSRPLSRSAHVIGVLSTLWGSVAWAEWVLLPIFYPEVQWGFHGLRFVPQLLLLQAGCCVFCIALVLQARQFRRWDVLLYGLTPFSYLLFHVDRVMASF